MNSTHSTQSILGRVVRFAKGLDIRLRGSIMTFYLRLHGAKVGRGLRIERLVHVRWPPTSLIRIEDGVYMGRGVIIDVAHGAELHIGKRVKVMHYAVIAAGSSIRIGDDSQIAEHCSIRDSEHATSRARPINSQMIQGRTLIGADVWIGRGAAVLMNSHIEDGAVVAANSVVRGLIPRFAIAAGAPATVRKYRDEQS
jgi:acetyltransferase-like isoleucine patch superfamily enzyme